MIEGPWVDWSVKNHIDEVQRLMDRANSVEPSPSELVLAQIHATLALTKAKMGQFTRGY